MTAWTDLFDDIMPEVPGCTEPVALNALKNAVARFFIDTKIFSVDIDPIDVVVGQGAYTVALNTSQQALYSLVGATEVWLGTTKLAPITKEQAEAKSVLWRTETGPSQFFVEERPGTLQLVKAPDISGSGLLRVKMAVQPSRTAVEFESWIAERFREELCAGAKYRLMAMQKKPWSNPDMALYYQSIFQDGVGRGSVVAAGGVNGARMRTTSYSR